MNPYSNVPYFRIYLNAVLIGCFGFLLGAFAVDLLFSFHPEMKWPDQSKTQLEQTFEYWVDPPKICNTPMVELETEQQLQCNGFENKKWLQSAIFLGPIFLFLVFFQAFSSKARSLYQQGEALFSDKSGARAIGVVTNPALAPADLFALIYSFKRISIELKDKNQVSIYISSQAQTPEPGQDFECVSIGYILGARRYFGVRYMPHAKII